MIKEIEHLGKKVGVIDHKTGEFISYRKKEHIFHRYNAFGISDKLLIELRNNGVKKIVLKYRDAEKINFESELRDWLVSDKHFSDGTDRQTFISIADMKEEVEV